MFDLQEFVASCRRLVGQADGARQVLDLMRRAVRDPEVGRDLAPAGAQRDILDAPLYWSSELTILNVALQPHFATAAHDHRIWAVVGIYEGREDNVFYRRAGDRLEELNRRTVASGEAILLGADVIHAIANPLDAITRGLHVYGGDLFAPGRTMWRPGTDEPQPFEKERFFEWSAERISATAARAGAEG